MEQSPEWRGLHQEPRRQTQAPQDSEQQLRDAIEQDFQQSQKLLDGIAPYHGLPEPEGLKTATEKPAEAEEEETTIDEQIESRKAA